VAERNSQKDVGIEKSPNSEFDSKTAEEGGKDASQGKVKKSVTI